MMNKLKLFLLIFLVSPMTNAAIELLDKVAVVVEDGIILESEVNKRIEQIVESLKQSETPLPPQEVLFEQIIERMIIEEIQLQKAQRAGVRISDQELNESMAQIAQGNGLSLQDFRSFLEEQGESYEFVREQVRKEMILSRIQRGLVQSKVYISEQELDNFIKSEEGQVNLSAEFLIQQILVPINRDQDEEVASSIIDSLKEKISAKLDNKINLIGRANFSLIQRQILVQVIDQQWKAHLLALDQLRQGIGLRAYAQRDPLNEYKRESFTMFEDMLETIRITACRFIMLIEIETKSEKTHKGKSIRERLREKN